MASYSNIYASLAQLSVKGQADDELMNHQSGVLDVFTSAFYTHTPFALGFIRSEDQGVIKEKTVTVFQPPRSLDILHDVVICLELPGMMKVELDGDGNFSQEADLGDLGYKANVGQYMLEQVQLEIGGSVLDTLHGELLMINEELNATPGKRLYENKVGEVEDSRIKTRTYVPLAFWFQGGSLSRALKLVSMQLHRIDFRVTHLKFADLLKDGDYSDVYVRSDEAVSRSTTGRLIGKVREAAAVSTEDPRANGKIEDAHGALCMDFHGVFLNSETRAEYLGLQESTLFTINQRVSISTTDGKERQETLDFKNAVHEMYVVCDGGSGTWGIDHAEEPLTSLSFSLSSTPRTLPALESQFYRKVTQFLGPNKTSSLMNGLYYYSFAAKNEVNGTNLVSSFVNASKIDDLRIRYATRAANDGGTVNAVRVYARAYNLLTIKNGMASKLFQ